MEGRFHRWIDWLGGGERRLTKLLGKDELPWGQIWPLRSRVIGAVVAASAFLLSAWGASASAAPVWDLDVHHGASNFPPGGTGEYWFTIANIGDEPSSGPVRLTLRLPPELTRASVSAEGWSCPGSVGDTTVSCVTDAIFPPASAELGVPGGDPLAVTVNVSSASEGQTLPVTASIEGGGVGGSAGEVEMTAMTSGDVVFGIVPGSLEAEFLNADGSPVRESGGAPELAIFSFDLNNDSDPLFGAPNRKAPVGAIRGFEVALPPGLVGDTGAVAECMPAQLIAQACPPSSLVGRIDLGLESQSEPRSARFVELVPANVYNMNPPEGVFADFAFNIADNVTHLRVSLDPGDSYAAKISVPLINQFLPVYFQRLTLRGQHSERALITMPSRCGVSHLVSLRRYDSWLHPSVFGPEFNYRISGPYIGCDRPRFEPKLVADTTNSQVSAPTGMAIRLDLPQVENPSALATPPVEDIWLTLPEGMTLSPPFVDGLTSCSEAQVGLATDRPVDCPGSSRIGSVALSTPLLSQDLEGTMYLAEPSDNPFGSLLAVFLVIHDVEDRGVLLKVPGRIDLDADTGQVSIQFNDLPQLPFEQLSLRFRGGARSPLVNPPSCGTGAVLGLVSAYARPRAPVAVGDEYAVAEGSDGAACAPRPFAPRLAAGALNPRAAASTPFVMSVTRIDRDQLLGRGEISPPAGLAANLTGVPVCGEAVIASVSAANGTGRAEAQDSSCPAASRVGSVRVGVGAGPEPLYLSGKAYLGGPYRGAPLSLAVVVPAVAGPLDLGTLVTRVALHVDPESARLRAVVDPLPRILAGIPLDLRDLRIELDRPGFAINPTSCDPTAVTGEAVSREGTSAALRTRFQLGGCDALGFRPALSMRLLGPTHKGAHPALRANLAPRRGEANIRRLAIALPATQLLDSRHIRGVCSRALFATSDCPRNSIYGRAAVWTPLLDQPLRGPVYLRESRHRLPDLVVSLGGRFEVDLVARVDSVGGRLRLAFGRVPDLPVRKLELDLAGGRRGLLVNTGGLCRHRHRAASTLVGHNGKRRDVAPVVRAGCPGR